MSMDREKEDREKGAGIGESQAPRKAARIDTEMEPTPTEPKHSDLGALTGGVATGLVRPRRHVIEESEAESDEDLEEEST